jgi:hypothetical protein
MPILSTELLSNYYTILLNKDGNLRRYILESWNENLQQDVAEKSFIQGDIGTRVVEFSNPFHQATMSGPILILKDLDAELTFAGDSNQNLRNQPTGLYDIFDLILDNLNMIIRPLNNDGSDYFSPDLLPFFLDSATISINNSEVNTTATVTSIYPNGFSSNNFNVLTPSTVSKLYGETRVMGRVVKFWDFGLRLFGDHYAMTQATINIKVVADKVTNIGNNFYNGNVTPDFIITGYSISGDATISIMPSQLDSFKLYQAPGYFYVFQNSIGLALIDSYRGNRIFDFGSFLVPPRVEFDMRSSQLNQARVSFQAFVRRSY